MKIATVGIDLAKTVFQVHGVNEHGKTVLRKQLKGDRVAASFANMPPCLVGRSNSRATGSPLLLPTCRRVWLASLVRPDTGRGGSAASRCHRWFP